MKIMDAKQFTQEAKQESQLNTFLKEIAEDVANKAPRDETQRYVTVTGVDVLISVAAYAFYRWIKDYFDHRRALNEAEILKQQERIISALIKDGFPPREAKAVTATLLKRIAQRNADDIVLRTAARLAGKGD
jgi:hypothetical protein